MARVEVTHVTAGRGGSARPWRSARLRRHSDFQKVYRSGRRIFSTHMTIFFLRQDAGPPPQQTRTGFAADASPPSQGRFPGGCPARVGFTIPRMLGTAAERNRIRRRLREAVRVSLKLVGDAVDVIIHPKKSALTAEFTELREELARVFERIRSSAVGPRSSARDLGL